MPKQMPLGHADFVYAYSAACDIVDRGDWLFSTRAQPTINTAVKEALDELRELRRVKRLPAGAKELTERITNALHVRRKRLLKRAPVGLHDRPTWEIDLYARYMRAATYAAGKALTRAIDVGAQYQWKGVDRVYFIDRPGARAAWPSATQMGGQWTVYVYRKRYFLNVVRPGITMVDSYLVLDACPIEDVKMPPGVRAAYEVLYLGDREFDRHRPTRGIVVVPKRGAPYLADTRIARIRGALGLASATAPTRPIALEEIAWAN